MAERARLEIACGSKAHRGFESPPLRQFLSGVNTKGWGQHQSQWILMKDAALDKDPQSIISFACANRLALRVFCLRQNLIRASLKFKVFIAVG